MLRFENVSKSFKIHSGQKIVLEDLNLNLPEGRSLALLGRNGAGKTTLLRLLAGIMQPDSGHIHRDGEVSWPVGLSSALTPAMTGAQNARFIARVYGVDTEIYERFVYDFAEIGEHYFERVSTYSQGMRARLSFGMSMGIEFDYYLVDELLTVGDTSFANKCRQIFNYRLGTAQLIMAGHQINRIRTFCDSGMVLYQGKIMYFDDVEDAIYTYRNLPPGS